MCNMCTWVLVSCHNLWCTEQNRFFFFWAIIIDFYYYSSLILLTSMGSSLLTLHGYSQQIIPSDCIELCLPCSCFSLIFSLSFSLPPPLSSSLVGSWLPPFSFLPLLFSSLSLPPALIHFPFFLSYSILSSFSSPSPLAPFLCSLFLSLPLSSSFFSLVIPLFFHTQTLFSYIAHTGSTVCSVNQMML